MSNIKLYDWIPFFAEVCCRLVKIGKHSAVVRDRKMEELSREVFGDDAMLVKPENLPVNPFTFIYTLASKNDAGFYQEVKKIMSLNAPAPTDLIFPTPPAINPLVAPKGDIKKLWKLFSRIYRARHAKRLCNCHFVKFLRMKNVGLANATQCMFLINPSCYLPLDKSAALEYLRNRPDSDFEGHGTIEEKIMNEEVRFHKGLLKPVRKHFACLQPYEINLFAYLKVNNSKNAGIEPYRTEINRIGEFLECKDAWQKMRHCRFYPCCLRRCRIVKLSRKK